VRLRARLDRLASRRGPTVCEVWHQAENGADTFTSSGHPDLVLTRAQLEALPDTVGVTHRIIVLRVDRAAS
jgi:hypothetical protein